MQTEFEYTPKTLPLIALRNMVAFPNTTVHLDVGRKMSVQAVLAAMKEDRMIFLVAQKNPADEIPKIADFFRIGTYARIKQCAHLPGEDMRITVECLSRAERLDDPTVKDGYLTASISLIPELPLERDRSAETEALYREAQECVNDLMAFSDRISQDLSLRLLTIQDLGFMADYIAQNVFMDFRNKQVLLETRNPKKRIKTLIPMLMDEAEILSLEQDILNKARESMARGQKEYFIREQIHALQDELGEGENPESESEEYRKKILALKLPEASEEVLLKEAARIGKMPYGSQETSVIRTYLDTCLDLPWNKFSNAKTDISRCRKVLEGDHFGLQKVKERILENVAVMQMKPEETGQILCLVGPPGTGKTSVAQSVARALQRKFVRVSLGGVHDESEIRGHRRTYIGSMPGKIISAIREAKVSNPVILLDEIDKLSNDYKGDPSSALLEVLDPEQNKTFKDHFLDIPYDLSRVLFIATANLEENIPRPLWDRMEIIELSSYTHEEKFHIAKQYLIPKQLKKNGLTARQLKLDDSAIHAVIQFYTRESGVRSLDRTIASLCRKSAKKLLEQGSCKKIVITDRNLAEFLGSKKHKPESIPAENLIGVVTGLAYTSVGGETMAIEVNVMDGTGKLELTGSLGDVMKESAHAAVSFIRANTAKLGVEPDFYKTKDIHIHAPEGAVPKDGPSAGITMATALISALTNTPVNRTVAMTGEITLRGRVLPIGGLKEKTMAAYKAGVKTIIIPKENETDLEETDPAVRENVRFVTATTMDDVLPVALVQTQQDESVFLTSEQPSRTAMGIRQ